MRKLSNIIGIGIDKLDVEEVLGRVEDFIGDGRQHQMAYINAHCLNYIFKDKEYRNIISGCDLVYPDGMAIVWASYLYGDPLPERVNLGDFLYRLCQLCVDKKYKIFFLGGHEGVADKTASNLKTVFPELEIAGTNHGFFKEEDEQGVINKINSSSPDILLVGMGVPRQEKWIARNKNRLKAAVLWSVGGLFDYYAGRTKRSPVWMRRVGLEWLFRLTVEPSRLWKRYIIGNILFLLRLFLPFIVDMVLVASAWICAYWLRFLINPLFAMPIGKFANYICVLPLIVLPWPFICSFFGLYRIRRGPAGYVNRLRDMLKATSTGLVFAVTVSFAFREAGIARSFLIIWVLLNFFLLFLSRRILKVLSLPLLQKGAFVNVLIIGTSDTSLSLEERLKESFPEYRIAGFLKGANPQVGARDFAGRVLGEFRELDDVIKRHDIDEVVLIDEDMPLSEELNLVIKYLNSGINFRIVSKELAPFAERVKLSQFGSLPVLEVSFNEPSLLYIIFKELMDKVFAFLSIIITLPLWLIIIPFIKADSKGAVVFVQKRVGKDGREFKLYKFRTMFKDTPPDKPAPVNEDDPRVTRVGRFLRRCSLDELPQLLNVLKGDMSIVGPRPEMPFIVKNYQPWQRQRLKVKPGITGLWQVAGRKDIPLHDNIEYDFYYINNRSLMLDAAIILKSIPAIILRKGAY